MELKPQYGFAVESITNGFLYKDNSGNRISFPDLLSVLAAIKGATDEQ